MSDLIGQTLGHYRIVEKIGEGGMGVVYRARDERLDRDVAIKVLPVEVAGVQERLERFEREAKLLASLNHPNIATLHGLENEEHHRFLVMELVEGESLATVIARGALSPDEAMPIAIQIAQALEAAHEHGVIHRDLKPANVMVGPEGQVKVLDFGLAKAFDPTDTAPQSPESIAVSPTITADLTRGGVLLGTAAYMSPEQARGKPVDKRADIWAFGCTLFEMLARSRPFGGESSTEVLAAVIKEEPEWDALPPGIPAAVRRLLTRCLTKDPRDRLHDTADARIELQESTRHAVDYPNSEEIESSGRSRMRIVVALALAATTVVAALGWISSVRRPPTESTDTAGPRPITRFTISTRGEDRVGVTRDIPLFVISADGSRIAWIGGTYPNWRIFTRALSDTEIREVPGTNGASHNIILLSPDGREVCFDRDDTMWKVPVAGGSPIPMINGTGTEALVFSGHWGSDGTIVLQHRKGLIRLSAAGGAPKLLTKSDRGKGEPIHWNPRFLPDGSGVLFTSGVLSPHVEMIRFESGESRKVLENVAAAWYLPTGHLLYGGGRSVFAVPVDPKTFEVAGEARPVLSDVEPLIGRAEIGPNLAISDNGTLVYLPYQGTTNQQRIAWISLEGESEPIKTPPGAFSAPSLSPDGSMIVVWKSEERSSSLQIVDLNRRVLERLTGDDANANCFAWNPDGKQIAYSSSFDGLGEIFVIKVGVEEAPHLLARHGTPAVVEDWSPDGAHLLYSASVPGEPSRRALFLLPVGHEEAVPIPWVVNDDRVGMAQFSPDGRWIAYVSREEGRAEVFVREVFPERREGGEKRKVTRNGGWSPVWSPSGERVFFRNLAGDAIFSAEIRTDPSLEVGEESVVVEGLRLPRMNWGYHQGIFDISPDGSRFLTALESDEPEILDLVVVLNWFEELKRLVPTE